MVRLFRISIHAPSRERLFYSRNCNARLTISIHAPSRERPMDSTLKTLLCYFNPRSLAGATFNDFANPGKNDISIHAPSRERRAPSRYLRHCWQISIHAPSRERRKRKHLPNGRLGISIHAPSRERPGEGGVLDFVDKFQSTLPRGSDGGV